MTNISHYFSVKPCKRGHISARHKADRSCLECRNLAAKKYWSEHKQEKKDYDANYNKNNRKKRTEYMKKWGKENPSKIRLNDRLMKIKRRAATGKFTRQDLQSLLKKQKNKCSSCKAGLKDFHVDHIEPIASGGDNSKRNIQLLCPPCNRSKGAKDPIKWAQENGRLL